MKFPVLKHLIWKLRLVLKKLIRLLFTRQKNFYGQKNQPGNLMNFLNPLIRMGFQMTTWNMTNQENPQKLMNVRKLNHTKTRKFNHLTNVR